MAVKKWMEYNKGYHRRDDDSTNCLLMLVKIDTGEIQLMIHDWDTAECMRIGFTNYIGGGRSPNVLKALENLALAIEKDNEKNPLPEWDEVTHEKLVENQLALNKLRSDIYKKQGHRY